MLFTKVLLFTFTWNCNFSKIIGSENRNLAYYRVQFNELAQDVFVFRCNLEKGRIEGGILVCTVFLHLHYFWFPDVPAILNVALTNTKEPDSWTASWFRELLQEMMGLLSCQARKTLSTKHVSLVVYAMNHLDAISFGQSSVLRILQCIHDILSETIIVI